MTRITSTGIGSQSSLYRRVPFRVLLLGTIVLVATVGTGIGLVAADSTAVQQQSTPANNSSNESLTDTVVANSSNVSTVNATNNTTANESESESETTPAVTNRSAVNGTANPSVNTTVGEPTSNGSEVNATSTTTVAGNQSDSADEGESGRESENVVGLQFAFPNQTTNGTSVTVREPRLPEGGFLVIHGRSYPENGLGSVIGVSEYIAPNSSYERVQIRLFDVAGRSFEQSQLRAPSTMYVQAVLDTNGNQQYDALATTGAQDVSYLIDGSRPAVAGAWITVNQPVETASQPEELGDGFVPDQNQTTAPSTSTNTNNSESATATSGDGFVLNPNQGSGFDFESVPTSLGNFGPLLVLLGGLAVGIYIKQK